VLHAQPHAIAEPGVDLKHPSAARVYDYLLGGSANWAIDRKFAHRLRQNFPEIVDMALANRGFLNRVVRHLSDLGIKQFLDIGSGIRRTGNTHQLAPDSRVVYVEHDPVAFAHGEVRLDEEGDPDRHAIINVDLGSADETWDEAAATGILDPGEPVAVLLLSVLHILRPAEGGTDLGTESVARLRKLVPSGSYLALSHVTDEGVPPEIAPKLVELKHLCDDWLITSMWCRSQAAIKALFGDFQVLPPGLVWTPEWHPEEAAGRVPFADRPSFAAVWGGVGQKI
jgi:S-adenosyl methyltransferase